MFSLLTFIKYIFAKEMRRECKDQTKLSLHFEMTNSNFCVKSTADMTRIQTDKRQYFFFKFRFLNILFTTLMLVKVTVP